MTLGVLTVVSGCSGSGEDVQPDEDTGIVAEVGDDTASEAKPGDSAVTDVFADTPIEDVIALDDSLSADSATTLDAELDVADTAVDSGRTDSDSALGSDSTTDVTTADSTPPKDTNPGDALSDSSDTSRPDSSDGGATDAGPSSTRHTPRPLGSTTAGNGFYEYLPPGYVKSGPTSALIVFWHGLGENGNGTTDLSKVLANGPPKLIKADKWPATRPFVVLSPQNPGTSCPSAASIKSFIAFAVSNYNVDPLRIYLTGLSCGAIGSWDYLRTEVKTTPIAAAVLIAGNGSGAWDTNKCDLGRIPIWAFHGDKDTTVDPKGTTYPMTNLIACPSPPRKDAVMTIYPGVGHDSWSRTYDLSAGHDVYTWMLDHHK